MMAHIRQAILGVSTLTLSAATAATSAAQQGEATNQAPPPTTKQVRDPEGILNLDIEQLARTPVVVPSIAAFTEPLPGDIEQS